jgi:hypothetical protein
MVQRHIVVIPNSDGGLEVFPLKEWLRSNPERFPDGLTTKNTSHQLRSGLRKLGWTMQDTPEEIRLSPPGSSYDADRVSEVLGDYDADIGDEGNDVNEHSFSLEYQLRDFLAANLDSIDVNGGKLSVYVDELDRDGVEYSTGVGLIDILAVDKNGNFYVFELKRANSPDKAFGQVARYMGWLKQTIGKDRKVYGVIISKTVSRNLRFAKTISPDVYLYEYEVSFTLKEAHAL